MLKHKTAVILLAGAYFISLCHTIIPHHHHSHSEAGTEVPCANDDRHSPFEKEHSHHPFCHFEHDTEDVIFSLSCQLFDNNSKQTQDPHFLVPQTTVTGLTNHVFQRILPDYLLPAYRPDDINAFGLRGPPSYIV